MPTNTKDVDELRALPKKHGAYTQELLAALSETQPIPTTDAMMELISEVVPFNERLTEYCSSCFGIPNEVKSIKKRLREEALEKGLDFSSANLSQWITKDKWEVFISPKSLFKLCLAMNLDIAESKRFSYECLHQTWLNYRVPEEAIYIFFIGLQDLFGMESYREAESMIAWMKEEGPYRNPPENPVNNEQGVTGYTRILGSGIRELVEKGFSTKQQALDSIKTYLIDNAAAFTGVQRSAINVYNVYFSKGAIGIPSLTAMYKEKTGLTLPETSYLDNAYIQEDARRKRLLWGTVNRSEWLAENDKDLDILNEREIRTEEHAVGRMQSTGIPRGNIIALLFFHFCFERQSEINSRYNRDVLFSEFYEMTNITLVDECGMMPLHPRKQLDSLFLRSIANSGAMNPIEYLNQALEDFYAM